MQQASQEGHEFLPGRRIEYVDAITKQRRKFNEPVPPRWRMTGEERYQRLLKEKSVWEERILVDLNRTFPRTVLFRDRLGLGQTSLFNVLKAYSVYDPRVGYCQGTAKKRE